MAFAPQVQVKQHLLLSDYEREALATNKIPPEKGRDLLRFGLFGEIGGVLGLVKKSYRDLVPADHNAITEELGDALWYLTNVAHAYGVTLQQVGERAMATLHRHAPGCTPVQGGISFDQFDAAMTMQHAQWTEDRKPDILRALASQAGQVMAHDGAAPASQQLFDGPVLEMLSDVLADMVILAALFKQLITTVAEANIAKIKSRWPGENPQYLPLFDEEFPELEQFPREFDMHFIERRPEKGRPYVIQRLRGVNIGDRLTDNRTEEDGYRFHDVFHLAYLTHLGWSPVIRALLKLKRKSDPDVDENQDGARAIIIEEGIATWIFNLAHRRDYFRGVKPGRLDYNMLKQLVDMVDGYEVHQCPLWQWEKAVLDGFRIFLELRDSASGCGVVKVNLLARTIEFVEEPAPDHKPAKPKPRPKIAGALPPDLLPKE